MLNNIIYFMCCFKITLIVFQEGPSMLDSAVAAVVASSYAWFAFAAAVVDVDP